MQNSGMNKLAQSSLANLSGFSALVISAARKELGRNFQGGNDHEFVLTCAKIKSLKEDSQPDLFTKG